MLRAACSMPPSMYSAMMGSISSPIRNSTTRGRTAEFAARLVCACASPEAQEVKISARIKEPRHIVLAILERGAKCESDRGWRPPEEDTPENGGFGRRCEDKKAGEEISKKE